MGFPMKTADGEIIFAVGQHTLTAYQILELLDRGELHAEGVRRLVEAVTPQGCTISALVECSVLLQSFTRKMHLADSQ